MYRIWLSGLGVGFLPGAPGTWGSALVMGVYMLVVALGGSRWVMLDIMAALAVVSALVTVIYGGRGIRRYGSDPSLIVSDEICGQAVTYLGAWPISGSLGLSIVVGVLGFFLFRFFDILKPGPIRTLEKVPGAWGVLLDDVLAGVFANVILQVLWWTGLLKSIWG